jgi:hypothetical protein
MKKLRLDLQELQVETFESVADQNKRGTVVGHYETEGYTVNMCGECYSEGGAGLTCGCPSYPCTQDPGASDCISDYNATMCGDTCFLYTCRNC